jgi:hypothetical protein
MVGSNAATREASRNNWTNVGVGWQPAHAACFDGCERVINPLQVANPPHMKAKESRGHRTRERGNRPQYAVRDVHTGLRIGLNSPNPPWIVANGSDAEWMFSGAVCSRRRLRRGGSRRPHLSLGSARVHRCPENQNVLPCELVRIFIAPLTGAHRIARRDESEPSPSQYVFFAFDDED